MTPTPEKPPAGTGWPPARSSAPPGRSSGAAEDGEGRADAPAKRETAGTDTAAVRRAGRGRADEEGDGATAYGAREEGATVSDRMENVVLPGARRSDRFHLRNDNRIR
ncbi:hypothetical protein GCM10017778_48190 [Streptomyces vinaceus]|nr:hypothetical protein GCM10017778_48190 [Streptomyces vinaceus]